jgi:transposase InsO family protein
VSTPSKTIQLGIIIVALQLLASLNISVGRLVRKAAAALGVSRKSGYEAARRIVARLSEAADAPGERDLRRKLLFLEIKNQVLTFERDHPRVRFGRRKRHLPAEAKALCVRLLREFGKELSEKEIATVIGVPLSNLRRWAKEADSNGNFPERPERRGKHRRATPEDVQRVLETYKNLEKSMTLEEFTEHLRTLYPERPLDRRTITRILQRAELLKPESRKESDPYHEPFQVYFPGAQVSIDATELKIAFKSEPAETIRLKQELAIDIATGAIVGEAVGREETQEGVERVLVKAHKECQTVLSVLSDNGTANRAQSVTAHIESESEIGQIFSFPYHPQTNGHLEGLFGQFKRLVEDIELDDSSREKLARSVLAVILTIFIHFHNYSPRARLNGLSPVEYLRRYVPRPEEIKAAREGLKKQQERSRALREKHPRLRDPLYLALIQRVLELHRFDLPIERAARALLNYDRQVIESASNALYVQSKRDGFDERKRTFAYFFGIVRNKQKQVDDGRLAAKVGADKSAQHRMEQEAHERVVEREKAEEKAQLRSEPDQLILQAADLLLRGELKLLRRTLLGKIHAGLASLQRLGRGGRIAIDQLAITIRSWGQYSETLKEKMVAMLYSEYASIARG